MAEHYVALLRGINVGGKHQLPMADLTAMCVALGCQDVRTYIQSGNVLFTAEPERIAELPGAITAAIAAHRSGYRVPVVVRSADELGAVIQANPFVGAGAAEAALHVYFLADAPDPARVARLDPDRSPPGTFAVHGREIYLRMPSGMGRTKLTNAYFDAKLATVSTARNWRTVTTLYAMLAG